VMLRDSPSAVTLIVMSEPVTCGERQLASNAVVRKIMKMDRRRGKRCMASDALLLWLATLV
jgi:hypothetical protein